MARKALFRTGEREQIATMLARGYSTKTIATALGRSKSAVVRELKKPEWMMSGRLTGTGGIMAWAADPLIARPPMRQPASRHPWAIEYSDSPQPAAFAESERQPLILVIDDDRDIVRMLEMRLRTAGYKTVAAHDGAAGLTAAVRAMPDAIVLDIRMPNMDGLTMLEKLRDCEQTTDIPAIMLSGRREHDNKAKARELGAFCFLRKPCQPQELVNAVELVTNENSVNRDYLQ